MQTVEKPELRILQEGASLKIFQVTATKGMQMPEHYATKEAAVIVLKGSAILKIGDKEQLLEKGDSCIIPAKLKHSLLIKTDFLSNVIMEDSSTIEFT